MADPAHHQHPDLAYLLLCASAGAAAGTIVFGGVRDVGVTLTLFILSFVVRGPSWG